MTDLQPSPRHWRFIQRPYGYRFGLYAQIQLEPRDLWVGVFWRLHRWKSQSEGWDIGRPQGDRFTVPWTLHVYLCVVPILPLHISLSRKVKL
jgi:hypothetical protein